MFVMYIMQSYISLNFKGCSLLELNDDCKLYCFRFKQTIKLNLLIHYISLWGIKFKLYVGENFCKI
jgi:hypothetical protein